MANNFMYDVESFPFTNINDKDFIALNYQTNPYNYSYELNTPFTVFNFSSFNYKDYGVCDYEKDIDPDNKLYNDMLMSCKYYTEQQLNFNIPPTKGMGISIIHFNARNLNKSLVKITDCIHGLKCSFDVIAITETWMDQTSSVPDNSIPGYNMFNAFRTNKRGGGVALYIQTLTKENGKT